MLSFSAPLQRWSSRTSSSSDASVDFVRPCGLGGRHSRPARSQSPAPTSSVPAITITSSIACTSSESSNSSSFIVPAGLGSRTSRIVAPRAKEQYDATLRMVPSKSSDSSTFAIPSGLGSRRSSAWNW